MSDEFTMKALEEKYKALLKLRYQRAHAERSLAQIDEQIAKLTPKVIALAALVDEVPEDRILSIEKYSTKPGLRVIGFILCCKYLFATISTCNQY